MIRALPEKETETPQFFAKWFCGSPCACHLTLCECGFAGFFPALAFPFLSTSVCEVP
jgi:hypothetical protein